MVTKAFQTVLQPNSHMRKILKENCDYRRYCFNQALATWQDMYHARLLNKGKSNPNPSERKIRDEMVRNKADWQFDKSARILQLAVTDLKNAMQTAIKYRGQDYGFPHFQSKRNVKQGFKTDRLHLSDAKHIILDKPKGSQRLWYPIRVAETLPCSPEQIKIASITFDGTKYTLALSYDDDVDSMPKTHRKDAIDANVGHFNDIQGSYRILPKKLARLYRRIKFYQRRLAKKRRKNSNYRHSHNYRVMRIKLRRDYEKVSQIQHDLLSKYTTHLVHDFDTITIEDLDVKHMQMSHVASKGLQRSQFGEFKRQLKYKCAWYGKILILADRFYPSTQRCSHCGYIKTDDDRITLRGNAKHHTNHHQYICYQCGFKGDRDQNAVQNLLQYQPSK